LAQVAAGSSHITVGGGPAGMAAVEVLPAQLRLQPSHVFVAGENEMEDLPIDHGALAVALDSFSNGFQEIFATFCAQLAEKCCEVQRAKEHLKAEKAAQVERELLWRKEEQARKAEAACTHSLLEEERRQVVQERASVEEERNRIVAEAAALQAATEVTQAAAAECRQKQLQQLQRLQHLQQQRQQQPQQRQPQQQPILWGLDALHQKGGSSSSSTCRSRSGSGDVTQKSQSKPEVPRAPKPPPPPPPKARAPGLEMRSSCPLPGGTKAAGPKAVPEDAWVVAVAAASATASASAAAVACRSLVEDPPVAAPSRRRSLGPEPAEPPPPPPGIGEEGTVVSDSSNSVEDRAGLAKQQEQEQDWAPLFKDSAASPEAQEWAPLSKEMDPADTSGEQDWAALFKEEKELEKWQCLEDEKPEDKLHEERDPENRWQVERQPSNWIVKCGSGGARPQSQRLVQRKAELAKGETGQFKLMQVPGDGSNGLGVSMLEVKRALSGNWEGDRSESYSVNLEDDDSWTCMRHDGEGGEKGFPLYWDEETCCVWWGKTYFLDVRELQANGGIAHWHPTLPWSKMSFVWRRISEFGV